PLSVSSSLPLCASHTLAVASKLPVTIRAPSGEKATELTLKEWRESSSLRRSLCASHTLAAPKTLPVTMRVPSGDKATELTLDPRLSVSSSTTVGGEAVVKAVSLGACEAAGAGVFVEVLSLTARSPKYNMPTAIMQIAAATKTAESTFSLGGFATTTRRRVCVCCDVN